MRVVDEQGPRRSLPARSARSRSRRRRHRGRGSLAAAGGDLAEAIPNGLRSTRPRPRPGAVLGRSAATTPTPGRRSNCPGPSAELSAASRRTRTTPLLLASRVAHPGMGFPHSPHDAHGDLIVGDDHQCGQKMGRWSCFMSTLRKYSAISGSAALGVEPETTTGHASTPTKCFNQSRSGIAPPGASTIGHSVIRAVSSFPGEVSPPLYSATSLCCVGGSHSSIVASWARCLPVRVRPDTAPSRRR